jgi:hypothetical protein
LTPDLPDGGFNSSNSSSVLDLFLDLSLALALAWRWISSRMDFVRATASLFFFALPASSLMAFFFGCFGFLAGRRRGRCSFIASRRFVASFGFGRFIGGDFG